MKQGTKMLQSIGDLYYTMGKTIVKYAPSTIQLVDEIMKNEFDDEVKCMAINAFICLVEECIGVRR